MTVPARPGSLERELEYRKKLNAIVHLIASTESVTDALTAVKNEINEVFDAERMTIYAIDTKNQELYSLVKIGDIPKEIRVPKAFSSIAGFTALARRTINIKDAYDTIELARIHANLRFDVRWDKQTGFRTRALLAVPILYDRYLLGVVQFINKRHGVTFTAEDEASAEELARVLGIALYDKHRSATPPAPSTVSAPPGEIVPPRKGTGASQPPKLGKIFGGGGSFAPDPQLCFVLMPFAPKLQPVYEDHIKPTVEAAGLVCQRADDIAGTNSITWDIWERINRARFLIADLTDQNANVFYELGLAHALSKDVILLTQSMTFVPFDLRALRCIPYDFTPRGVMKLQSTLKETLHLLMRKT